MNEISPDIAKDLLEQLKATLTDKEIWPDPRFDEGTDFDVEKAKYDAEALAAWDDLFSFTCQAWDNSMDEWRDTPDMSGVDLCAKHWMFHSCPRRSFIEAIQSVALKEENRQSAGFLYFMMGVLGTSWPDYLQDLHSTRNSAA